ncbi:preprotein translocase subunit YajC [Stackebrandtia soli]|uniref:preprotein translocase subunit YajC n=1 Tax=Stackebrandtia soli TaxID=1892856 RepID=UPI0039EC7B8D
MLFAQEETAAGGLLMPLIIILMLAAMYFLMIRPQNKRRREMMEKQRQAGPGMSIVTIGGLHGTIIDTDDTTVTIEVSPGVMCVYERGAIARVIDDEIETATVEDEPSAATTEDKPEIEETSTDSSKASKDLKDGTQN